MTLEACYIKIRSGFFARYIVKIYPRQFLIRCSKDESRKRSSVEESIRRIANHEKKGMKIYAITNAPIFWRAIARDAAQKELLAIIIVTWMHHCRSKRHFFSYSSIFCSLSLPAGDANFLCFKKTRSALFGNRFSVTCFSNTQTDIAYRARKSFFSRAISVLKIAEFKRPHVYAR